ncbi:hypothetical protein DAI22_11g035700 [Oryza sativa Japonica Group]|uniref:Rac GTPase activating protein 1 n=2 Tax=Oryza sativa subsp. japonica TaxID=39947 RepID=H2KVZ2_ORYSJ|nr:rac GTPase activating protein 1 [Oryza sativa Japonica Group]ABG22367.1 rac GTPase activating protein 1, putative, expressed [Oryza sativa Japonica Group]KAF2909568.1 hypothetical protein DAI22_11g035700 [Oryza sativa Japonica Group]
MATAMSRSQGEAAARRRALQDSKRRRRRRRRRGGRSWRCCLSCCGSRCSGAVRCRRAAASAGWRLGGRRMCSTWHTSPSTGSMDSSASPWSSSPRFPAGLPVRESMQCSYDSRGNSVPTILLMMQRRLYEQGGLRAEGIFRINAENSQEEFVRDQLNSGIVPDGIDIHCLSGLIKAWFRELPSGVLDSIPPEQVMQCQSEEDCARVAKCLPPAEAALLEWAVNLMADVVQEEQINKMNARNIAMVFAPNMTQMSDPLTALMYAVQVMNFLKMLIQKTLKGRQESNLEDTSLPHKDPSDESGHHKPCLTLESLLEEESRRPSFVEEEPILNSPAHGTGYNPIEVNPVQGKTAASIAQTSEVQTIIEGSSSCSRPSLTDPPATADPVCAEAANSLQRKGSRSLNSRRTRKGKGQSGTSATSSAEKSKGTSIVSRINSKIERIEAWR